MPDHFNPAFRMIGEYLPLDGTIEFYGRINAILKPTDVVVDLGAGRGAWHCEDTCEARRRIRDVRSRVARVIGVDIDPVVLANPTTTENRVVTNGELPIADRTADLIIADYVLEHVTDVRSFVREVERVLKPKGFLCARTPHKYHYVSVSARFVENKRHGIVLSRVQPRRKSADIFPTAYRLNTLKALRKAFPSFQDYSYLYSAEPAYYFDNRLVYNFFCLLHRVSPPMFVSNLLIFLRKN